MPVSAMVKPSVNKQNAHCNSFIHITNNYHQAQGRNRSENKVPPLPRQSGGICGAGLLAGPLETTGDLENLVGTALAGRVPGYAFWWGPDSTESHRSCSSPMDPGDPAWRIAVSWFLCSITRPGGLPTSPASRWRSRGRNHCHVDEFQVGIKPKSVVITSKGEKIPSSDSTLRTGWGSGLRLLEVFLYLWAVFSVPTGCSRFEGW